MVIHRYWMVIKASVCSLGVLLDLMLLMDVQKVVVAKSVYYQLRLVWQLQPILSQRDLDTITHALGTAVTYSYMGLPLETTWKLQMFQNAAAHTLTGSAVLYYSHF